MSKGNGLKWNERLLPDSIRAMFDEPKKPVNYNKVIADVSAQLDKNRDKPKTAKASKYHNKKIEYEGHIFDSIKEMNYYKSLQVLQRAGEIVKIELQPVFPYIVAYSLPAEGHSTYERLHNTFEKTYKYIGDFRVTYKNGNVAIIDAKGVRTAIYKRKKKIIEALYNIKIVEV